MIKKGSKGKFYLCAFVNYQHRIDSADKVSDPYTQDNVDDRFDYFKECVDQVNELNSNKKDTATYGINFFCDLNEEEKGTFLRWPYSTRRRLKRNMCRHFINFQCI